MICVYKILSPDLKECYVGSAVDFLRRKSKHKSNSNDTSSKLLFEKYGYDNCIFVVLEQCTKEERKDKEQWWIDHSVGLVNQRKAIRTEAEWIEQKKAYSETHKEQAKARMKAYYETNKGKYKKGGKYSKLKSI